MNDIIIIIFLILLNGVFSMSEIALISARKSRLISDAKNGSKSADTALKLADDPDKFLSTIQIGITLIGILTGLYSGAALSEEISNLFVNFGLNPKSAHIIGQILIVAIVTFLSIVIGELVPKRIGLAAANVVSKIVARPMHLLSVIAMPIVWLLSASTSIIVKLLGLKDKDNNVTEEEIKSLIQDGTDSGEVKKVEQDIMERALVLGDLRVSSIMTPKVDVVSMHLDMTMKEITQQLSDELHNAYPVYCNRSKKSICGIVSLKQLILKLNSSDFSLKEVISEPEYFPESMSVYDALDKMKAKNVHFAIVCDEFGDIAGVITPSDILDGLVGALPQQSVNTCIVKRNKDNEWVVDARIQFYDFINYFELEDLYKPASYSTLGGLILEELRHIPVPSETIIWNNIRFEVVSMDGAKIEKVKVTLPRNSQDFQTRSNSEG